MPARKPSADAEAGEDQRRRDRHGLGERPEARRPNAVRVGVVDRALEQRDVGVGHRRPRRGEEVARPGEEVAERPPARRGRRRRSAIAPSTRASTIGEERQHWSRRHLAQEAPAGRRRRRPVAARGRVDGVRSLRGSAGSRRSGPVARAPAAPAGRSLTVPSRRGIGRRRGGVVRSPGASTVSAGGGRSSATRLARGPPRPARCGARPPARRASSCGTPAIIRPSTSRSVSPGTMPTIRPRYITAIRSASATTSSSSRGDDQHRRARVALGDDPASG